MKKIFLLAAIFMLSSTVSLAADSAFNDQDVRKFVGNIGGEIVSIANEKNLSEAKKRDKIIAVIDNVIDSDWIARFVLGKNYKTATDDQKNEFSKLYRSFMINTYGPKFKNYNGRKFTVTNVTEQNSFYVAKAEFLPRNSDIAIFVDFRVKDRNGKLVILDFITEGVSLIETQRSEFNSAISEEGIDKFLQSLRQRVENLKKDKTGK